MMMKDDFCVGSQAKKKVHLSEEMLDIFIDLSGDTAPLHCDDAFAREKGFEGRVVHGALLLSLLSQVIGTEFPGPDYIWVKTDFLFKKPCYAPCDIEIEGKITRISEATDTIVIKFLLRAGGNICASGETYHQKLRAS